jgi:hypothetical protein
LVHHIHWTTKAKELFDNRLLNHTGSFVLTFLADGTPFPHADFPTLTPALEAAANAGVTLEFVCSRSSVAEQSFDTLASTFKGKTENLVLRPASHGAKSWLHARMRYIHSSVEYVDIGPSLLEVYNPASSDGAVVVPKPLTRRLELSEQTEFESWLAKLPNSPSIGGSPGGANPNLGSETKSGIRVA